jgi:hypothetical protein|tara:strand:- start:5413 stop:7341 length:1929 start_codon:yes stop_codon:yes gene_type:complete
MIKVGIDCWALRVNGGGARYVFESLFSIIENKKGYKYILFLHPEADKCINDLQNRIGILKNTIKIKISSPGEILLYDRFVDIYYSPFNNISLRYFNKPIVSLLHDVQERHLPELFTPEALEGRHEDYDDIVRSSTRTITISEFCKQSIIEYCGGREDSIDTIYNAPQQSLLNWVGSEKIEDKKSHLGLLSHSFIFYPANFYAHKNHKRLLQAYSQCLQEEKLMPKLVLMGMLVEGSRIEEEITSLNLNDKVIILSDLSSKDVAWLYTHCCYVVLPTLYEGFCMPAVEALSFKKTLICSDLEILKEVTSGNAFYFDPEDVADISCKMRLGLREQHKNSININEHYSWKSSAIKTLEVFDRALVDFYNFKKSGHSLSNSSFFIYVDGEQKTLSEISNTLKSIYNQRYKPGAVEVLVKLNSNVNKNILEKNKNISPNFHVAFDIEPEEPKYYPETYDYYSYVTAGNTLSENYFLSIFRTSCGNSSNLIIGELHQVHEDKLKTFESSVYYRINRSNLILNGCFYPEMYISRHPSYITEICKNKRALPSYVASKITSGDTHIIRVNLAKVLYKNSLSFERVLVKSKRLNYTPVNFIVKDKKNSLEKLGKDQEFLDYVNTDIAKKLGQLSPPDILEAKRQMTVLKNIM